MSLSLSQRAESEKEDCNRAEEKISRIKMDHETEMNQKVRDAVKDTRATVEEQSRARFKTVESRLMADMEDIRRELSNARRKADDAERETELLKRQSIESLDKDREGIVVEFEQAQRSQVELQALYNQQKVDIKRMQEEAIATSERLAVTLQTLQTSGAECELAKQDAKIAISDSQTIHNALVQATQRLHDSDVEAMKIKSENAFLKQQVEKNTAELKKIEGGLEATGERYNSSELDNKRLKSKFEREVSRLSTRVLELEGANSVLQDQLDKAENQDNSGD